MRKTILTILSSALLAVSTVQIAAAAEHHRARKVVRVSAPASEPFRNAYYNSNAYYGWNSPYGFPGARSERSRYEGGAISAPAGH
jgi:hypothetical protein